MQHLKKLKTVLPHLNCIVIFFLLTILITLIRIYYDDYHTSYDINTKKIIGVITKIEKKEYGTILSVRHGETVLVTDTSSTTYHLGELVEVFGKIRKPPQTPVFHTFQYDQYLKSKHIYWLMKAEKIRVLNERTSWYYRIQEQFIKHIETYDKKEYLYAFILGDSSKLAKEQKTQLQSLGISHLFAISGMHVGVLSLLLSKLLSKFCSKHVMAIILTLFFSYYIFLTGASPSVIRAVVISIIFLWTKRYHRIHLLVLLASILLLYNPFYCQQLGFLFSFIISFFLLKFQHIMENKHSYLKKLWWTSWIAFLSSFPILIFHFYEINFLTVFYNLLFVPFVTYLFFPISLLTFFFPLLSPIYVWIIHVFEFLLLLIGDMNWKVNFCYVPIYFLVAYYMIVYLLLSKWEYDKWKWIILLVGVLVVHQLLPYSKKASITMLDVGQGDSVLIELKNNAGSVLIDTGGITSFGKKQNPFLVEQRTIPYLKSKGIKKLDALILTHGDYDHLGEATILIEQFPISNIILNSGNHTILEQKIIKQAREKKIPIFFMNRGTFTIANTIFYFLNSKKSKNENQDSLVCYTEIENRNILLMGDATEVEEKEILDTYHLPKMDILKLGHHGSNTSSSEMFLKSLQPKVSFISVGKNNQYGHPSPQVLKRTEKIKSTVYQTEKVGSVEIKLSDFKVKTYYPRHASA